MLKRIFLMFSIALVYWFPTRRWFSRAGATQDEVDRVMAGDGVIANPTDTATQAVTINAPPDAIWPWLVQLGYQRGGLYSYDWLDRLFGFLDRPSASNVLPEFQHLEVGDKIPLGPHVELTVMNVDPDRALVLSNNMDSMEWVWQFGLYPLESNVTRLVSRGTEHMPGAIGAWFYMRLMEPAAFIMTWRMLLGIKERAERLAQARSWEG